MQATRESSTKAARIMFSSNERPTNQSPSRKRTRSKVTGARIEVDLPTRDRVLLTCWARFGQGSVDTPPTASVASSRWAPCSRRALPAIPDRRGPARPAGCTRRTTSSVSVRPQLRSGSASVVEIRGMIGLVCQNIVHASDTRRRAPRSSSASSDGNGSMRSSHDPGQGTKRD